VPPNVPLLITELNIAWNTGESFVDTFGALWLADFAGAFFTAGGDGLYYFHYLPMGLYNGCGNSPGTFGMFTMDSNYQTKQYTSQYFASQLITQEWAQPGNGTHKVFAATSDITDPAGHVLVTAYSLLRPDGQWALMLINKDQMNSHEVQIVFQNAGEATQHFSGQSTESRSAVSNTSGTLPLFPQADRPIRMVRHRGPKLVPVPALRILFRKRRLLYYEERRRISKGI